MKVVDTGSMTRAAAELHVSQPALGLQIGQLEKQFNVELFLRHSRGAVPTAAGEFLYKRAKEILDDIEETSRAMLDYNQTASRRLTIGLTPSIARQLGASLLTDAQNSMPNTFFSFIEGFDTALRDAASRGEIDIGFMYDIDETPARVAAAAILREDFVLLVRGDGTCSDTADIPLREVLDHRLVFQRNHKAVQRALHEAAASCRSSPPDIAFEMQSAEAIGDIIEHGHAAAILPYGIMVNAVRSGRVMARRITEPTICRTLYVTRPQSGPVAKSGSALKFIELVRERLIQSLGDYCHPLNGWKQHFATGGVSIGPAS